MRACLPTGIELAPLPPNKRVNYTFGMVVGVDEFRQAHENLDWKDRAGNRLLHGSGTACGLRVSAEAVLVAATSSSALPPARPSARAGAGSGSTPINARRSVSGYVGKATCRARSWAGCGTRLRNPLSGRVSD